MSKALQTIERRRGKIQVHGVGLLDKERWRSGGTEDKRRRFYGG
jgi:hypothetical protein